MRGNHEWTIRDEDGVKREIRVIKEAGLFRFQTKRSDAEVWTYFDNKKTKPAPADVESLIDVLERKYQRKRAPYSDLLLAKKMLADVSSPK
jgi:radical SAM superfamily enzyme with C-terminal helix-hairpin-helix motif